MELYHKINSIYKRDLKGKFMLGDWATPELALLNEIQWEFTEKVDGTNIRVNYNGDTVGVGGRTNNAQLPMMLVDRLQMLLHPQKFKDHGFSDKITLYGEGYGHKIQKGGGNYVKGQKVVDFVLFDVKVGDWWLKRESVNDVAKELGIQSVPVLGQGTLYNGIDIVKGGLQSTWGDFEAEGIVARPIVDLFSRNGSRIITKIKAKDFKCS